MNQGPLIILSGPSGSGKSTVIRRLLPSVGSRLRLSVSATTRQRREKECDGVDYHFWTRERFEQAIANGAFLEWAEVHGNYYGTLRAEVDPIREQGIGVLLDIDVQGAAQVRRRYQDCVTVFLTAPSWEAYEKRIRARGSETEEAIQRRLETAQRELARSGEYQQVVVNDDLETAVNELRRIVEQAFERSGHAR